MKILVLVDHRVGSSKQAIAVAKALALPYKEIKIDYTFWANTPNSFGFHGAAIQKKVREKLLKAKPDIIITAGRRLARVAVWLKSQHPNIKNIHILKPGLPFDQFDLLILPKHDKKKYMLAHREKIIFVNGAVTYGVRELEQEYKKYWSKQFAAVKKPKVALFVGGQTKGGVFMEHHARDLVKKAINFTQEVNGSLILSNSRRTGARLSNIIYALVQKSGIQHILYDITTDASNPYEASLKYADYIIITGDSISMCAESIQSGKPIFIYAPSSAFTKKHQKFIASVIKSKQAQLFTGSLPENIIYPSHKLADLKAKIEKKLHLV